MEIQLPELIDKVSIAKLKVERVGEPHLKKELEVDRLYETQPRYWPVEIYSWGL